MVTPEVTKPIEMGDPVPMPPMPREFLGPVAPGYDKKSSAEPKTSPQSRRALRLLTKKPKDFLRGRRSKWGARGAQITALLISPNRRIADQFLESLGRGRAFEILADLRAYPSVSNLDTRIRQLRPTFCSWMSLRT